MAARTIGRLAEAAGVNVETVRYYERRGLIDQPERSPQGYRHYDDAVLWRLSFIRRAKDLGFTLAEIATLLETDAAGERSSARVLATASARLAVVEHGRELLAGRAPRGGEVDQDRPIRGHHDLVEGRGPEAVDPPGQGLRGTGRGGGGVVGEAHGRTVRSVPRYGVNPRPRGDPLR